MRDLAAAIKHLETARARIAKPGTWIAGVAFDRHGAFCAMGALSCYTRESYHDAIELLEDVLSKRIAEGTMPPLIRLISNETPKEEDRWETLRTAHVIAAFNNSTDQQSVLALFDEAIQRGTEHASRTN